MPLKLPQSTLHIGSIVTAILLTGLLSVGPLWLGAARPWIILPLLLVLWLIVLGQCARMFFSKPTDESRMLDAIDFSVVAFLIYATTRYFFAPIEYAARLELLSIYGYAGVFWIARYGLARKAHALWPILGLIAVGSIVAGIGLFTKLNPSFQPYAGELEVNIKQYAGRIMGTYGCPNHFGGFLVMASSLGIGVMAFSRLPWIIRILGGYFVLVFAVAIFLSYSRGSYLGWLACMVGLAIFATRHGTVKWWLPVSAASLAIIGSFLAIWTDGRASERAMRVINFADVRVQLARDSLAIVSDAPVFGTGPATFEFVHPKYHPSGFDRLAVFNHNDYLNMLTDYGVLGLLLALVFVVLVSIKMFRYLGSQHEAHDRLILAGCLGAWLALVVHSAFDFNLHIPGNALILFFLTGLGLRDNSRRRTSGWFSRPGLVRPLAIILLIATLILGYATLKALRGNWGLIEAQASREVAPFDFVAKKAERAFGIDPGNYAIAEFIGDQYRVGAAREEDLFKRTELAKNAEQWYRRSVELNPLYDRLKAMQALSFDLMERYNEAYILYQKTIEEQPYNGFFRNLLGHHLWRRNEIQLAKKTFQEGTKLRIGGGANRAALEDLTRILKGRSLAEAKPSAEDGTVVEAPPSLPGFVYSVSDAKRPVVPLDDPEAAEDESIDPENKLPLPPKEQIPRKPYQPKPDDPSQIEP